jgi:hypothetical protein
LGSQKADIEFRVPFDTLKQLVIDLAKVAFWVCQKADNSVAGCVETVKHRFNNINQVVIYGGQKAGNEFFGFFHHLNYRFFDLTKSHYATSRKQIMISQGYSTT